MKEEELRKLRAQLSARAELAMRLNKESRPAARYEVIEVLKDIQRLLAILTAKKKPPKKRGRGGKFAPS